MFQKIDSFGIDPSFWDDKEFKDIRSFNYEHVSILICPNCHKPGLDADARLSQQTRICWNCRIPNFIKKTASGKAKVVPLIKGTPMDERRLVFGN